MAAGRFREDLFYRLNADGDSRASAPGTPRGHHPARDALHQRSFPARNRGSPLRSPAPLTRYRWPDDRELRNAMERAALLSRGEVVLPEHLPARVISAATESSTLPVATDTQRLEEIEREAILKALRKTTTTGRKRPANSPSADARSPTNSSGSVPPARPLTCHETREETEWLGRQGPGPSAQAAPPRCRISSIHSAASESGILNPGGHGPGTRRGLDLRRSSASAASQFSQSRPSMRPLRS
jgi:hypothetical protein